MDSLDRIIETATRSKDEACLDIAVAALRKLAVANNAIAMRRSAQAALAKIWEIQK